MNDWLPVFFLLAYGVQRAALLVARRFIAARGYTPKPPKIPSGTYYALLMPFFSFLAVAQISEETTFVFMLIPSIFYGFLLLFVICDLERHWLPRCFTVAFLVAGMACQGWIYPDRGWLAVIPSAALGTGLLLFRRCVNRRNHAEVFGLGDVYLIAGLAAWFSVIAVLEIAIVATGLAMLRLLVKKHRFPARWRHQQKYRGVPFAPFLCGVAALWALFPGALFA